MVLVERKFGLDLIRSVAIILVMFSHSVHLLAIPVELRKFIFSYFGFIGVEIFFVLSGFLIGGVLLKTIQKTGGLNFKSITNFWARRWIRTLPSYYLILIVNFLLILGFFDWRYLFFVQNLDSPHPQFFGEAWSLSIEEWFYFVLPLVLAVVMFVVPRKQKGAHGLAFLIVFLVLIIAGPILRMTHSLSSDLSWDTELRKVVIYRPDSIVYGMIVAYFLHNFKEQFVKFKNSLFFIGLVGFFVMTYFYYTSIWHYHESFFNHALYFSLFSLFVSCQIPFFYEMKITKLNMPYKLITNISIWSYSLYLVHNSVGLFIINGLFISDSWYTDLFKFFLFWICSLSLGYLMTKYFEKPILNWRDQKFKSV